MNTKMNAEMTECVFCKIIDAKIPAERLFESETVLAFKDIHPQASHHYLIIPKFHVDSLAHLKTQQIDIIEDMYRAALHIAEIKHFKDQGFRTVINTGEHGGQTVHHLHMHLLSGGKIKAHFGEEQ